jgi:hypothetical protein
VAWPVSKWNSVGADGDREGIVAVADRLAKGFFRGRLHERRELR